MSKDKKNSDYSEEDIDRLLKDIDHQLDMVSEKIEQEEFVAKRLAKKKPTRRIFGSASAEELVLQNAEMVDEIMRSMKMIEEWAPDLNKREGTVVHIRDPSKYDHPIVVEGYGRYGIGKFAYKRDELTRLGEFREGQKVITKLWLKSEYTDVEATIVDYNSERANPYRIKVNLGDDNNCVFYWVGDGQIRAK